VVSITKVVLTKATKQSVSTKARCDCWFVCRGCKLCCRAALKYLLYLKLVCAQVERAGLRGQFREMSSFFCASRPMPRHRHTPNPSGHSLVATIRHFFSFGSVKALVCFRRTTYIFCITIMSFYVSCGWHGIVNTNSLMSFLLQTENEKNKRRNETDKD